MGWGEDLQVAFLIELSCPPLCCGDEEFGDHGGEDTMVAHGMIAQCSHELFGHARGIAGGGQEVREAVEQLLAGGILHHEPGARHTGSVSTYNS